MTAPDSRADRALSFGPVAEAYERARPGYPEEAVAWLAGEPLRDVVDVGAGTGKLTRQLAAAGHRVVAIEPLREMRAALERAVPGVRVLAGTAEELPLPGACADVVAVAQAFHWFDRAAALAEIARVLRPGGTVAIVWNARDDSEDWVAELSEAATGGEKVDDYDVEEVVAAAGAFGPVQSARFHHTQRLDRATLLDLVLSRSYCAVMSEAERRPVLDRVEHIFDVRSRSGEIELPYVTECFKAARLTYDEG